MSISEHSGRELGELFGLSRDAVLGVRGGMVVFANPAAAALFGDCAGRLGEELLPDYVFAQEDGSFVCTVTLDGRPAVVSGVRRDGLLLLSVPREESGAVPAVSTAVLAELRTTAYNLRMAAELIVGHSSRDAKLSAYASILSHNYYTMTRLTSNLADIGALANGSMSFHPESLNLSRLCAELMDSVRHFLRDKGVSLRFSDAKEPVCVRADRERLEQLLLNLLSNSLRHTAAGDSVTLSLRRQGARAVLAVSDSGSGIPPAQLAGLFSLRESGPEGVGGAGMGLYIAQGIARLHGGTVVVQSREGQGTEVRVMLPASDSLPLRDATPEAPGAGLLLMELSTALPHEVYEERYFD